MTDYSELIRKARAVPGPTLLMTYPAQTTPDPLSNALADALEAQAKEIAELENKVTFEAATNLATAKLNANLLKRIAELEAALNPFSDRIDGLDKSELTRHVCKADVDVEWLRAARAALKGEKA